jgi:hypothetical protein
LHCSFLGHSLQKHNYHGLLKTYFDLHVYTFSKKFFLCYFYSGGSSSGIHTGPIGEAGVIINLRGLSFNISKPFLGIIFPTFTVLTLPSTVESEHERVSVCPCIVFPVSAWARDINVVCARAIRAIVAMVSLLVPAHLTALTGPVYSDVGASHSAKQTASTPLVLVPSRRPQLLLC